MPDQPDADEEFGSRCGHSTPPGLRPTGGTPALLRRVAPGYRYPDVSVYRPVDDWGRFADEYPVACCKTSEGLRVDPTWPAFLAGCRKRGILPVGYHFLRREWDAEVQALHFLRQLDGGPCGVMVDVETSAVRTNPTVGQASRWCDVVADVRRRPRGQILCYVPRWWWLAHGAGVTSLADTMAVNSDYRASPSMSPYAGFGKISVIQYTDRAPIAGVREPGDMNVALGMGAGQFAAALGCPPPGASAAREGDVTEEDKVEIVEMLFRRLHEQVFAVSPPIRQAGPGQTIGATYNKVGDVQSTLGAGPGSVLARIDFLYDQLARFGEPMGVALDPPPWRTSP